MYLLRARTNENNYPWIAYLKYKPILFYFFNTFNQSIKKQKRKNSILQEEEDEATHTFSAKHHHK
mgnify:CR=1 FL=1